ncbi:MarR family winged helix-turn-helix transcriptional regulator [Nocardioides sp. MH1]|uniref:MarR family winged helix-turn-helix transcriptional regulator n=1 Tax=Nocardioides sp. MH1 TaxID=3242490 RepID=UPI0035212A78
MPTAEKVVRTDAGLASELRISVMRLRRRLANERHPSNPLSVGQMAVLGALHRNGDLSVGALAVHERVQPPSMTRTVNCLADGGYVVRRPHESDGRQVVVALTETGRTVLLADRARRDEWLNRRLAELTPDERDALRRATPILQRLAQAD